MIIAFGKEFGCTTYVTKKCIAEHSCEQSTNSDKAIPLEVYMGALNSGGTIVQIYIRDFIRLMGKFDKIIREQQLQDYNVHNLTLE